MASLISCLVISCFLLAGGARGGEGVDRPGHLRSGHPAWLTQGQPDEDAEECDDGEAGDGVGHHMSAEASLTGASTFAAYCLGALKAADFFSPSPV